MQRALGAFASEARRSPARGSARADALPPVTEAIQQVHFPDSLEDAEAATSRFAFEELLGIELGVVKRRREAQAASGAATLTYARRDASTGSSRSLPFALTAAQRRAVDDVLKDIASDVPMSACSRATLAAGRRSSRRRRCWRRWPSGYQGAIMAPTEILAEQHFRTFTPPARSGLRHPATTEGVWFQETGPGYLALRPGYIDRPVRIALLRGGLKAAEKSAVQDAIARGEVDIAVGTHALIQQGVDFERLALAVVDEQHRFGVGQRAALREKGQNPHVLVMTATPIPRTLALTVYGDLDITVLDEMPPGRPTVKTHKVHPQQRQRARTSSCARRSAKGGRRTSSARSSRSRSRSRRRPLSRSTSGSPASVFPDLRLGLLHGRMSPAEKDATMRAFRDAELDVLVSTAVVEVGIDVPNATVMLIEGADRFGLTQLHQFRGRVRRGTMQAYCLLLSDNPSLEGEERLADHGSTSATASSWPRRTCDCGARASTSARASRACRTCASRS